MSGTKGLYVLIIECRSFKINIGSLGPVEVPEGLLAYVGSARGPGGLDARLRRHFKKGKAKRWHIDYLTEVCEPVEAWVLPGGFDESWLAKTVASAAKPIIKGFGSSDKPEDETHLFLVRDLSELEEILKGLGFIRWP